jgi:hypothetical protein
MKNSFVLSFMVDTTDPMAKLGFEAWLDHNKFYDSEHVKGPCLISVEVDDSEAEHNLQMVLKNKTQDHTQIDSQGNLVKDVRLTIDDFCVDGEKLGQLLYEKAVYTHNYNTNFDTMIQVKFHGELGCNGSVTLSFTTPVYLWLLENI